MILDAKLRDYIKGNVNSLNQGLRAPSAWAEKNGTINISSLESAGRNEGLPRGSGGTTVSDGQSVNMTSQTQSKKHNNQFGMTTYLEGADSSYALNINRNYNNWVPGKMIIRSGSAMNHMGQQAISESAALRPTTMMATATTNSSGFSILPFNQNQSFDDARHANSGVQQRSIEVHSLGGNSSAD